MTKINLTMKLKYFLNLFLLQTVLIGTLNAQVDTTGFSEKFVEIFQSQVVKNSFKDPYSFQLLSIKYQSYTREERLKYLIKSDSVSLSVLTGSKQYIRLFKNEIQEKTKSLNDKTSLLASLNDNEKKKIDNYLVTIECRGANSYGNLVYSKYIGTYYLDKNEINFSRVDN